MCIETRMRKRSMKVKRWRVERSEYGTHKHNPHTMYLPSPPHTLTHASNCLQTVFTEQSVATASSNLITS